MPSNRKFVHLPQKSVLRASEPFTGHADLDLTSKTSLRDILFNYTGRVDMSLYRKIGKPMSETKVDEYGNVITDTLNPVLSGSLDAFAGSGEALMDDYDYLRYAQNEQVSPMAEQRKRKGGDLDRTDPVPDPDSFDPAQGE